MLERFAPRAVRTLVVVLAAAGLSCQRRPAPHPRAEPRAIPVSVLADSSGASRLRVTRPGAGAKPPEARAWLARVRVAGGATPEPPLPEARPSMPPATPGPPPLVVDEGLKPPIPKKVVPLVVPPSGVRPGPASVELDVLVDTAGSVSEVTFAGGSDDSALVAAAVACARQMTFYPALQAGRPVAVWCRQRFDFGAR